MSKIGEPKVRFLSLSSLQTSRGGFLLAESALFTLLSLLIVADSGARRGAIAFFSSLCAFCHLADFRFSFFFLSFSHQARVLRPQQSLSAIDASPATLQQHPRPAPRSHGGTRREHLRHSSEILSPSKGFRVWFSSKLDDSKSTSRRITRRCPRRGEEEEALRLRQGRRQASSVEYSPNGHTGTKSPLPSLQVRVGAGPALPPSFSGRVFLAAELRYQGARDGRRLAPKLPQIEPRRTTLALRFGRGSISSHGRAGHFSSKSFARKTDYIEARARIRARAWRTGDTVRYMLKLRVFIADLGRSGLISFALFTRRRAVFFQNPPQLRGKKTDYIEAKSKDKGMGMEDGRYGTLCVEMAGFYFGSRSI